MRLITMLCSGISTAVLYVAMLVMVIISFAHDVMGIALGKITDVLDHFLGDQIQVFDEALNGKRTDVH